MLGGYEIIVARSGSCGQKEFLVEGLRDEVGAELVYGGEDQRFHAERRGSFDIHFPIVDKERLLGSRAKFF